MLAIKLLFSFSLLAFGVTGAGRVPKVIVNKGACPFECCQFGLWTAGKNINLFERPGEKVLSKLLKKGEVVEALTGEVHSAPLAARVTQVYVSDEEEGIHVGSIVYILHGIGEGAVAVWHNGKVKNSSMDLTYDLLDKSGPEFPESVWWVKIRLKNGTVAWVKDPGDNFTGMDSCS